MSSFEIGAISVLAMLVLIYIGLYVPVVLGLISFVTVWIIKGNIDIAISLLVQAASKTINDFLFGVIPLFVLMGLLVSVADMGRDTYQVAHHFFRKVRGGLGMATVVANAIFAAITGVSIASVTVFTRISVPEMLRFKYNPRFAVGVVAGSSVLGMLIPPSVLFIVYALIAEQSVGDMFLAGIGPGLLLTLAYLALILFLGYVRPSAIADPETFLPLEERRRLATARGETLVEEEHLTFGRMLVLITPIVILIAVVMGGIYGGVYTPTEAGAAGAFGGLVIALLRRKLTLQRLWSVLVETGHVTASILFLIITASLYSRMLGVSGLPTQLTHWIESLDASLFVLLALYVVILIILGTLIDSVSIMLITVPLFIILMKPFEVDLVWFGVVTVIGVEIGLLTPPFGLACYAIKSTVGEMNISLKDIFYGAAPFAATMFVVLMLIMTFPQIALYLVQLKF